MPISSTTTVVPTGATVQTSISSGATINVPVTANQNITAILIDNLGENVIQVAYTTGTSNVTAGPVTATVASVPVGNGTSRILVSGRPNTGNGTSANVSIYAPYGSSTFWMTPVA